MRKILLLVVALAMCLGLAWGCGRSTEPVVIKRNPFEGKKGVTPDGVKAPEKDKK